jgi:hypothetical protein
MLCGWTNKRIVQANLHYSTTSKSGVIFQAPKVLLRYYRLNFLDLVSPVRDRIPVGTRGSPAGGLLPVVAGIVTAPPPTVTVTGTITVAVPGARESVSPPPTVILLPVLVVSPPTVILPPVVVVSPPTVILPPVVVVSPPTVILPRVVVGIASTVVLVPLLPLVAQLPLHVRLSVALVKGLL